MNEVTSIINEVIRNRRSVYPEQFSKEKISDTIIEQLLENANWAPTHGITQPWQFTIFSGQGLQQLANFQSEWYKKSVLKEKFDTKKYDKLKNRPLLCSHIIAIGMKRQAAKKIPEIEEIEAVACAVQNILLSASSYGLGAYWGSGGITYIEEGKKFLKLDKEDKLLGFISLGYIKDGVTLSSGFRNPISDSITWVK